MYGTVLPTASLRPIRALPHGKKPGALAIPKLNYQFDPRLLAWRIKAALVSVSVSAANGACAAVVLVVEDEALIRCDVTEHLREAGYSVVETGSGEEAIAMCRSDTSIDIVFTDIHLIGSASGWDVAESVRADRPNVSVLYTSAKSIDHGRCIPGSAFLAKPYQCDDVVNACDRLRTK
jgi:two-component system, response regulator PdtaR